MVHRAIAETFQTLATRSHFHLSCLQLLETRHFPSCRERSLDVDRLHLARPPMLSPARSHCQWRQARRSVENTRIDTTWVESEVQAV